jgi:hypothetical protein
MQYSQLHRKDLVSLWLAAIRLPTTRSAKPSHSLPSFVHHGRRDQDKYFSMGKAVCAVQYFCNMRHSSGMPWRQTHFLSRQLDRDIQVHGFPLYHSIGMYLEFQAQIARDMPCGFTDVARDEVYRWNWQGPHHKLAK